MNTETPRILPDGISFRSWQIYIHVWLICLGFPTAALFVLRPPIGPYLIGLATLVTFAITYVWTISRHRIGAPAVTGPRASLILLTLLLITLLGLLLSATIDISFLWLFVGTSIIAGRVLSMRTAHLVATVLPLLAVATSIVLGGGIAGTDWLHILPLAFLTRALGLNMIGLSLQFATIQDLHVAREELARRAVSEERLRLARDLHDLLGHTLSLIVLKSQLAGRLINHEPERAAQEIDDLETVARKALREVRQAVAGYRQPTLQGELDGARQILEAAGIACTIDHRADAPPPAIDSVLGWSIREGVTNVIRHSKASRCNIRIVCEARAVQIEVINDTTLPDSDAINRFGNGLTGLSERVMALGGRIQAGPYVSGDIRGFRLLVEVPLTEAVAKEKQPT